VLEACELERAAVAGAAIEHAGGQALASEVADHLRAVLRDVICGHLTADLVALADELLLESLQSGEEEFGDELEPEEILDLMV
jgi:hypothetical protein